MSEEFIYEGAAGRSYSILLNIKGEVITMGNVGVVENVNVIEEGQRGVYESSQELINNCRPWKHSGLEQKIIMVKSGGNHHAALSINGSVYMWGVG